MIFCKKCGYVLPDDARFCSECGAAIAQEATADPTKTETATGTTATQNTTVPPQNPGVPPQNPSVPPYGANPNPSQGYYGQYPPQQGYYTQPGYPPPYQPYGYQPRKVRSINVGQLVFAILNLVMFCGLLAIWPLILVINAKNAPDDLTEAYLLQKAKKANITCLVIGIVVSTLMVIMMAVAGGIQ